MLTRAHRLTSSRLFAETVRRGRRAGAPSVVLHLAVPPTQTSEVRVGFVVSKAVGTAVERNRVRRRLRHIARERVGELPAAAIVVIRALPGSSGASYAALAEDVDTALRRLLPSLASAGSPS